MSETTNLHLKKHDNVTTNQNAFDIENYLNKNWDKIDAGYGIVTENQSNITALQKENNNLRKALPNIKGTGTDITLNNTSENKFNELVVEGNTEQTQLSGKNFYNNNAEITRYYYSDSGQLVEGSNGDTFINTIIENNIDTHYIISYKEKIGTTPYVRFSFFNGDTFIRRILLTNNNSFVDVPANTTKIDIRTDKKETKYFVDLQIEAGATVTSYEPYCGRYSSTKSKLSRTN